MQAILNAWKDRKQLIISGELLYSKYRHWGKLRWSEKMFFLSIVLFAPLAGNVLLLYFGSLSADFRDMDFGNALERTFVCALIWLYCWVGGWFVLGPYGRKRIQFVGDRFLCLAGKSDSMGGTGCFFGRRIALRDIRTYSFVRFDGKITLMVEGIHSDILWWCPEFRFAVELPDEHDAEKIRRYLSECGFGDRVGELHDTDVSPGEGDLLPNNRKLFVNAAGVIVGLASLYYVLAMFVLPPVMVGIGHCQPLGLSEATAPIYLTVAAVGALAEVWAARALLLRPFDGRKHLHEYVWRPQDLYLLGGVTVLAIVLSPVSLVGVLWCLGFGTWWLTGSLLVGLILWMRATQWLGRMVRRRLPRRAPMGCGNTRT